MNILVTFNAPTCRIDVIKAMRNLTGCSLVEAKNMVEGGIHMPPNEVGDFISKFYLSWRLQDGHVGDVQIATQGYTPPPAQPIAWRGFDSTAPYMTLVSDTLKNLAARA